MTDATLTYATICATPDDGAWHDLGDGVSARRSEDRVTLTLPVEYCDDDASLGYSSGSVADLLNQAISAGARGDCGSEEPGTEYWIVCAPLACPAGC